MGAASCEWHTDPVTSPRLALAVLLAALGAGCGRPGASTADGGRGGDRGDGGAVRTTTTSTAARASTATTTGEAELGGRAMTSFEQELMRHSLDRYTGDLDTIRKKKVLRVLTRNNSSNYFISNGQERGFQYELAKAFADELGVRLAVIVPASRSELEAALLEGEGDLIAAGTTITSTRAQRVRFTAPVRTSRRVLVVSAKRPRPPQLADLPGLAIHVSFRSTTHDALQALAQKERLTLRLVDVEDDAEMEEMIGRVAAGEYAATVADQDIVDLAIAAGVEVVASLPIEEPTGKGWVLRPDSPELAEAADRFVRLRSKDGLIKIFYDRYFKSARAARVSRDQELRADGDGDISRWDAVFQREGERVGLDWRLLAAVAFCESRFDPDARSPWGAVGLMQILPSTALAHGVTRLEDPAENIRAGASYLKYLVDRFDDPSIEMRQRVRFALASYNTGLGHVFDARALAAKTGKNPAVWFGNVEESLRLKKDRKWHEQTKFGFCRADETIAYVSKVQAAFDVFARHQPPEQESGK